MVLLFLIFFLPAGFASVETEFLDLLNKERQSLGISEVNINSALSYAAYLHSKDMAENRYFSHDSFDGTSFSHRIKNAGYSGYLSLAENIAYHSGISEDAGKVFQMWKTSPGHYRNMVADYNEIGLGAYSYNNDVYYTLDFGKRIGFPSEPSVPPDIEPIQDAITGNLNLNVNYTVRFSGNYNYYRFYITTNNPSLIKYKLGSKEKILSRRTVNKKMSLKISSSLDKIEFIASDKKGNTVSKIIPLNGLNN